MPSAGIVVWVSSSGSMIRAMTSAATDRDVAFSMIMPTTV